MATQIFTAVLHKEEDLYVTECLEVGTVSQGYTVEEAIANLIPAKEHNSPLPQIRHGKKPTGRKRNLHKHLRGIMKLLKELILNEIPHHYIPR